MVPVCTIASLIEALQRFPPNYRVYFNPGEHTDSCDGQPHVFVYEGTTSDGPGSLGINLRDAEHNQ